MEKESWQWLRETTLLAFSHAVVSSSSISVFHPLYYTNYKSYFWMPTLEDSVPGIFLYSTPGHLTTPIDYFSSFLYTLFIPLMGLDSWWSSCRLGLLTGPLSGTYISSTTFSTPSSTSLLTCPYLCKILGLILSFSVSIKKRQARLFYFSFQ